MLKRLLLIVAAALLALLAYLFFHDNAHDNDILFYGGTILTMSDQRPSAEAVLVKDGKIVDIGKREELMKHATPSTVLRDLEGRTLMPGFFDAHGHVDIATIFYDMVDLNGSTHRTPDSVWQEISRRVKSAPAGEWIFCSGYDPILTKGIQTPNLHFLDSLAPDNPLVIISMTLHFYFANSKAFEALGITATSTTSDKASYYEKDQEGKLSGLIVEQAAFEPFRLKLQEKLLTSFAINLPKQMEKYASRGITSMVTMGLTTANPNVMILYRHLSAEHTTFVSNALELLGKLPKRHAPLRHFIYLRDRDEALLPQSPGQAGDDYFRICGIKTWYDGSPYVGSMYLNEPYQKSPYMQRDLHLETSHRGEPLLTPQTFGDLVSKYNSRGWPVAVHAQGDRALTEVVDVLTVQSAQRPVANLRNRLEHCLLLPKNEIPRIASIPGLSVSFHVNHILYYGDFLYSDILGTRTDQVLPVRSTNDNKVLYSLHADNPMFDANPISLVSTAVNRMTETCRVVGQDQRVQLYDALKAVTIHAAWQVGMEKVLGSVEPGKYADFVILSANPYTVPPKDISTVEVHETIVGGTTVWKKD